MEDTAGPGRRSRFFQIYKRGQGYYVRMCTGIAGGIIILAGGNYLYEQLSIFSAEGKSWTLWLRTGVPAAFVVALGLAAWWIVGVNRRTADFMIATEGEMKKVSWSSRKEIVGSTKVVIFFTILLASLLFVVDIMFQTVFSSIGVLRSAKMVEVFKGFFGFD